MRTFQLTNSGLSKLRSQNWELKSSDLKDSIKSTQPGEWCVFNTTDAKESWIGYVNPLIEEKFTSIYIVASSDLEKVENFSPMELIKKKIERAYSKRLRFSDYEEGSRVFYGSSDQLPGLIVDKFSNATIVQINTAGLDRFREEIKALVESLTNQKAYLLDNQKYREKESLPTFEKGSLPPLQVSENGIKFEIRSEILQKVGFYYDHRENRRQLVNLLHRLKTFESGVDLFCYAGAWGLSALSAGVKKMQFVDQGDLSTEVLAGLALNGFSERGSFVRNDVFKFLDNSISESKKFDLLLCDPPAFAKSLSQKKEALEGYSKLHRKVLKLASPNALIAFSSCTHYVTHEEFEKNILEAAHKENKKLQLLYCGIQGWDHPVRSLADRSNYIKSFFYLLES